eukprot:Tbor_TRINITY_DN6530_c0_g1::TRINITY_DN6530_c0_g1_i1::g.7451::m.7451
MFTRHRSFSHSCCDDDSVYKLSARVRPDSAKVLRPAQAPSRIWASHNTTARTIQSSIPKGGRLTFEEISELVPILSVGMYGKEGGVQATKQRPQTTNAIRCLESSYNVALHQLELNRIDKEIQHRNSLKRCNSAPTYISKVNVIKGMCAGEGGGDESNGSVADAAEGCPASKEVPNMPKSHIYGSTGSKKRSKTAGSRRTVTIVTTDGDHTMGAHTGGGSILCPSSSATGSSGRPTTAPLSHTACFYQVDCDMTSTKDCVKSRDYGQPREGVSQEDNDVSARAPLDTKDAGHSTFDAIRAAEDIEIGIHTDDQQGVLDDAELDAAFASTYTTHPKQPPSQKRPFSAITNATSSTTNNRSVHSGGSSRSIRTQGTSSIIPPRRPTFLAYNGRQITDHPNFFSDSQYRSIGKYLADTKRRMYEEDVNRMQQYIDGQRDLMHIREEIYNAANGTNSTKMRDGTSSIEYDVSRAATQGLDLPTPNAFIARAKQEIYEANFTADLEHRHEQRKKDQIKKGIFEGDKVRRGISQLLPDQSDAYHCGVLSPHRVTGLSFHGPNQDNTQYAVGGLGSWDSCAALDRKAHVVEAHENPSPRGKPPRPTSAAWSAKSSSTEGSSKFATVCAPEVTGQRHPLSDINQVVGNSLLQQRERIDHRASEVMLLREKEKLSVARLSTTPYTMHTHRKLVRSFSEKGSRH